MDDGGDKHVLAVDLGTSGPKVALFTSRAELVAHEFEPTRLILHPGGGAEQDPDDWWRAICVASRRLLARKLVTVDSIVGLCCTAQWSGTVAVDRNGRHLMNAVIWMDTRGSAYTGRILGGFPSLSGYALPKLIRWVRLTGGVPGHHGKDPTAHISFIQHARPEVYAATHKFLEPKDYLNLRLTGKFEASYDSITLHWVTDNRNINQVRYRSDLLRMAGLERDKLPELHPPISSLGTITRQAAQELGLNEQVQVVSGSPDVQSAAIGSGAVDDFAGHIYLGTSSWISCHVPFKKTDVLHNVASLPSGIPGRYLMCNTQETAGGCLNYLRDNVFYPGDGLDSAAAPGDFHLQLNRLVADTEPGCGRLLFLPHLFGERCPVDDHRARAAWINQSLRTTRAHLARAVYEGVAYNARWLLTHVERFIGRRMDGLRLIGGGARSEVWCQMFADILNRPIFAVAEPILANARGAALQACVALGEADFERAAELVPVIRTHEPDPDLRGIYDELFAAYLEAYRRLKPLHRKLNR